MRRRAIGCCRGVNGVDRSTTRRLIGAWLSRCLSHRWKGMNLHVIDSGSRNLSEIIRDLQLQGVFPQWKAWDVKVAVTGVLHREKQGCIALIDFVAKKVTLDDVAGLLGYARAINPILCMAMSREGAADSLLTLVHDYGRHDVLRYGREIRHIRIGQWNDKWREVDPASVIPRGMWL